MKKFSLSLSNLITKSAREVTRHYQREVAQYNITASQAGLIFFLEKTGPSTQAELAKVLHLDKTNVNAMVKKLIQAGHIETARDSADQRKSLLELSENGRELAVKLQAVDDRVGEYYRKLAGNTKDEAAVRRFLEKIVFGSSENHLI